ncbi:MAG: PaaI family thioesterase [Desulfosporosinus sp.]|jgi:1,4-dihydroxy-2-naphthoyl-CoA hydrolase
MDISAVRDMFKGTLMESLGMEAIELSPEKVIVTMPVNKFTKQPAGILHGGASVALAETVASLGTYNLIDTKTHQIVGMEINANHIRAKSDGIVTAVGTPLHKGRRTMVWDVKIFDEDNILICASRSTIAIIDKKLKNLV